MVSYAYNRPDAAALERLLTYEHDSTGGVIVRLAWYLGLMRGEIQALRWTQVDAEAAVAMLPDRKVPIPPEMHSYLAELKAVRADCCEYVVSSRKGKPLAEQYISRLARQALDRVGQRDVRLLDLRHSYVVAQLQEHDWQYVSQVSGIGLVSLTNHFMSHIQSKKAKPHPAPAAPPVIDPEKIAKLIASERFSPAGTLICLSARVGLHVSES